MTARSRPARLALVATSSCPALGGSPRLTIPARSLAASASAPARGSSRRKRSKAGRRPVEGVCANCGCTEHETGQWREDRSGSFGPGVHKLCSACGLYYNNHHRHRPQDLCRRGQRSSPPGMAHASRRTSGDSGSRSTVRTSPPSSSSGLITPTFANSPDSYEVSPLTPPSTYPIPSSRSGLKLRLTVGAEVKLSVPASREHCTADSEDELTIVLGSDTNGGREVDGKREFLVSENQCEGRAIEGLLSLCEQKDQETVQIPTRAPARSYTSYPRTSYLPPPHFKLLNTRPSFLYNPAPREASPLLPWPVPGFARAYRQPSERVHLPPMRGVAQPSRHLPSLRTMGLA